MRKLLTTVFLILIVLGTLVGCQSNNNPTDEIETDGTQESILDSISQALKDIFD